MLSVVLFLFRLVHWMYICTYDRLRIFYGWYQYIPVIQTWEHSITMDFEHWECSTLFLPVRLDWSTGSLFLISLLSPSWSWRHPQQAGTSVLQPTALWFQSGRVWVLIKYERERESSLASDGSLKINQSKHHTTQLQTSRCFCPNNQKQLVRNTGGYLFLGMRGHFIPGFL